MMLEHLRHVLSDPMAILFAVLFVSICVGIGNTIGRCATATQPRSASSRRNRRI